MTTAALTIHESVFSCTQEVTSKEADKLSTSDKIVFYIKGNQLFAERDTGWNAFTRLFGRLFSRFTGNVYNQKNVFTRMSTSKITPSAAIAFETLKTNLNHYKKLRITPSGELLSGKDGFPFVQALIKKLPHAISQAHTSPTATVAGIAAHKLPAPPRLVHQQETRAPTQTPEDPVCMDAFNEFLRLSDLSESELPEARRALRALQQENIRDKQVVHLTRSQTAESGQTARIERAATRSFISVRIMSLIMMFLTIWAAASPGMNPFDTAS